MINKKVVIWGCSDFGKFVLNVVKNEIHFLGFTSNDLKDRNSVQKYIDKNKLKNTDFDFILIASQYYKEILQSIVELGIDKNKIINFYKLHNRNFKLIKYREEKTKFDTLVFGMSYSECGIYYKFFKKKIYNFSMSSQDIYYTKKTIEHLLENEGLNNITTIILEFPYYTLNYDLSKTKNIDVCYQNYLYEFKDLHNYNEIKFDLAEFYKYDEIIDKREYNEKFIKYYTDNDNFDREFKIYTQEVCREEIENIKKISNQTSKNYKLYFNRNYKETYNENLKNLEEILEVLGKSSIKVQILIAPSLLRHNKKMYVQSKNTFYEMINDLNKIYRFEVLDFFEDDEFNEDLFKDYTHLNCKGAKLLSLKLNANEERNEI